MWSCYFLLRGRVTMGRGGESYEVRRECNFLIEYCVLGFDLRKDER